MATDHDTLTATVDGDEKPANRSAQTRARIPLRGHRS